jgi:hypothetical protein
VFAVALSMVELTLRYLALAKKNREFYIEFPYLLSAVIAAEKISSSPKVMAHFERNRSKKTYIVVS